MYQVNDYIVYSAEGVCQVEALEEMSITGVGEKKLYYVLQPVNREGKIYTPVDTKVFMRPVISEEQAKSLIEEMPSMVIATDGPTNSNLLREFYKKYLVNYDCTDLIHIIKITYEKGRVAESKRKKSGETDRYFLKKAEELLYNEFSIALDIPAEDVREYIATRIEQLA